jgi:hypothetical protein
MTSGAIYNRKKSSYWSEIGGGNLGKVNSGGPLQLFPGNRRVPGEPELSRAALNRGDDLICDVLVNVEAFGRG